MKSLSDLDAICAAVKKRISRGEKIALAIDGCAASGKTTLAAALSARFGAPVIHMDDFFLRPEQRTPERYAEAGGNVDYERFLFEVAPHIKEHVAFSYRRFDCKKMALEERVNIPENDVIIVEGSYSCHVNLIYLYDIKVFVKVAESEQWRRIYERNGARGLYAFAKKWIPLEQKYFDMQKTEQKCDFVIDNT